MPARAPAKHSRAGRAPAEHSRAERAPAKHSRIGRAPARHSRIGRAPVGTAAQNARRKAQSANKKSARKNLADF